MAFGDSQVVAAYACRSGVVMNASAGSDANLHAGGWRATSGELRAKLREFQGDRLVLALADQHSDGLLWRRIAVIGSG